jgi:replication initiation and membrane attachment protein
MELNGLDKFKLITYQNLNIDERNVLTLLYQPLIGCTAFTLYLTLWSFIDRTGLKSDEYLHYKIYDITRTTPQAFLKARKKLEAIGLLVAYHNDDLYLYELKAPLTAQEFIQDGSLGAYLFSTVGKENFDDLVGMFRISKNDTKGFKNITATFDDEFECLPKKIETKGDFISKSKAKKHINHSFDFDVFLDGLSKNFVDRRKITRTVKEKIINLSYVYNLDEYTMQKVFMESVDKDRNIDLEKLSLNSRSWYDFEKEEVITEKEESKKEMVTHNKLVEYCKTETPEKILSILSNGKPSVEELKVIERLIERFELSVQVINFMVVYVIGNLQSFPAYAYFDKVAIDWQRSQVKTVEDAIKLVKVREERISKYKEQTKKPKNEKNRLPKDIESDWLDDYIKNL